jgi:hypothetical protein
MSAVWNASTPNGGDSLTDSAAINQQYTTGDLAWITFAAAIVWIMIPGIGYNPIYQGSLIQIILRRIS